MTKLCDTIELTLPELIGSTMMDVYQSSPKVEEKEIITIEFMPVPYSYLALDREMINLRRKYK